MIFERYKSSLPAIVGLILLVAYFAYRQPMILQPFGITLSANQGTALALAALAQLVVVITGGVDLSVGAIVALTNCVAATYMGSGSLTLAGALVLTVAVGALAGLFNGLVVAFGRVQPVIVTLATLFIYTGFALLVRPQPGGSVQDSFAHALTGSWGYLPYALVFLIAVIVLFWIPLSGSRLGRALYAIGDNRQAAQESGVNVRRTELLAYVAGGVLAACAGIFLTAYTTSGDATTGTGYTLNSLAAVVLGGAVLGGGRGVALGPVFGAFFLSLLISVLFAAGISPYYQNLLQGSILLVVLVLANLWRLHNRDWLLIMTG
ncbi:Ribose import permease protein RbsC [Castellaniella defragrans]